MRWIACIITLFAGITMVSNVPYYSFKDIKFRRSVPFWAILLVALAMSLIFIDPPTVLFLLFVAYSLSGYVVWVWNRRSKRPIA
jgi:CDP-diacylglycerol---serine O-phosphatidyltransferase